MEHNSNNNNNNNRYSQNPPPPPPPPLSYPPRFSSDNRNFYNHHHQFPTPPPPPPPPPFHNPPRFTYFPHIEDEPPRRHLFDAQSSPRVSSSSDRHHHHHNHHHDIPPPSLFDRPPHHHQVHHHDQFRQPEDDHPNFYPEEEVHRDHWIKPTRFWDQDAHHRDRPFDHSDSPYRRHHHHRESPTEGYYFVDRKGYAERPREEEEKDEQGRIFPNYSASSFTSRRDGFSRNRKDDEFLYAQDDRQRNNNRSDGNGYGNRNVNYRHRYNLGNNKEQEMCFDDVEDRRKLKNSARLSSIIRERDDTASVDKTALESESKEKMTMSFDIEVNDEGQRVFTRKPKFAHQQQPKNANFKSTALADGGGSSQEVLRTPIKKRTSVLLRVQSAKKPTPRKWIGGEKSHPSAQQHFNDTNSVPSRCRGPLVFSENKPPREDRAASPVEELDVSFKSNSLVAKAKSVPSNSSDSPVIESNERLVEGDSSKGHSDPVLSSKETLVKSKVAVIDAETGPVDNNGSQPCKNGTSVSIDHGGVKRSLPSTIVCSDGICKPEVKTKKKKKKKKKKGAAPNLGFSSSNVAKVLGEPVNKDSPTPGVNATVNANLGLTQSVEKVKDAGNGIAGFQSGLNGNNALPKNMDIKESPSIPMEGSDVMCTAKKRTRSTMVPLSGLSSSRKTEVHDRFMNANSSNEGKIAASGIESMDGISLQPSLCLTMSIENSRGVGLPPSCLVGSDDSPKTKKKRRLVEPRSGFPRLMVTKCHDEHAGAACSTQSANAASSSENSPTHFQDKVIGLGIAYGGGVASPPSCLGGSDDTTKTKKRRRSVDLLSCLSRSRETENHDEPVNVNSATHSGDASSSSPTHTEEKVIVSDTGNGDNVRSQPLLKVASLCEDRVVEQSPSSLAVDYDGEHTPMVEKMNKQKFLNLSLSSSWVTEMVEGPEDADTGRPGAGNRSDSYKAIMQPEGKVLFPDFVNVSDGDLQPSHQSTEPFENRGKIGFPPVTEEDLKSFTNPNLYTHLLVDPNVLNMHSSSLELEGGQQDVVQLMTESNSQGYSLQKDIIELETEGERDGQIEVDAAGGGLFSRVTCEDIASHLQSQENVGASPLDVRSSGLDERVTCTAFEADSCELLVKDELLSTPSDMSPGAECSSLSISNSNEGLDCTVDREAKVESQGSMSSVPELQILNSQQSNCYMSSKKGRRIYSRLDEKSMAIDGVLLNGNNSSASDPDLKAISDETQQDDHLVPERSLLLKSEDKQPTPISNLTGGELSGRKTHSSSSMPKLLPGRATPASGSLKQSSSSTPVARHRTWHRTDNISSLPPPKSCLVTGPSQRQTQKRYGKDQSTSYIRKGHSLVRNSAPVASRPQGSHDVSNSVYRLNSVGGDGTKRSAGSEAKVNNTKPLNGLKTGFERVTIPTLPHFSKSLDSTTKSLQDIVSAKSANPPSEGAPETTTNPTKISESKDAPKQAGAFGNQAAGTRVLGTQSIISNGKSILSTANKIIYVKHKSNQLVAAPHTEIREPSANAPEKNQAAASSISQDQYYKRNKNQLVRNVPSVQSHLKSAVTVTKESSHSEGQRTLKVSSLKYSRNLSRQRPDKNLFPWKRMIYWRKTIASGLHRSSSSLISSKLLLSRKRDTVYTRSTGGFSLRRSKVLSIGGSNLKWSKSIEKHSKKASEEATLAVAAVEKKKREQKGAAYAVNRAKNRNQSSRERIFRIGSVRYRMDSSRRTLQRIPDEKSSSGLDQRSGRNTKMSFIPKRLMIGNNEYVRIGNGNQLVRDPKTRIRILASEKVRWSLHTARLRLARKQQYCQFFTRFGKCNKDGGKCPYIHDPAKIAVCTKFLKGLCSNANCKLTHKVIPERMQDCSYFMQGVCTNECCPYRHVNVNPNASVCEGFLRGYCADGDECHKRHSYVCPQFESTGGCPQGTKCKLHHPRSCITKNRKRKRSKENTKKTRERYFGSNRFNGESQTGILDSGKHTEQKKNEDGFSHEGILGDYISLGASESEEEEEAQKTTNEATPDTNINLCCDSLSVSDLLRRSDYLDDDVANKDDDDGDDDEFFIKPVAIMNIQKKICT